MPFFIPVHDHVADENYALARAIPNDEYSYARVFPGKNGDAPLTVLIFPELHAYLKSTNSFIFLIINESLLLLI